MIPQLEPNPKDNCWYLRLGEVPFVSRTVVMSPNLLLDFDADGVLVGIEGLGEVRLTELEIHK